MAGVQDVIPYLAGQAYGKLALSPPSQGTQLISFLPGFHPNAKPLRTKPLEEQQELMKLVADRPWDKMVSAKDAGVNREAGCSGSPYLSSDQY